MRKTIVAATSRTPMGKAFRGTLRDERPDDMATQCVNQLVAKVPELNPDKVDDLILGCGSPGGMQGFNIARVVAVQAGWDNVPGVTVNRYCASSLQAVRMAMHAVRSDEGDAFIVGGVESTSSYAYGEADSIPNTMNPVFDEARERSEARKQSGAPWADPRVDEALPDIYIEMGQTAENVAQIHRVSRSDMDDFALLSQRRAMAAVDSGFWQTDIDPYVLRDGTVFDNDESMRPSVTAVGLSDLKPAFREGGSVTAGTSCPLNDGASSALILSEARASELGVPALAEIVATGVSSLSPEVMGLGPIEASRRALANAGMQIADIDLVEVNEAFAAMVLPTQRELGIHIDRLNVNGGAIAIGHPFGSTGTRLLSTMLNSLRFHDKETGLITMCTAGGQGMALIVRRIS
ncbi:acetyl-CoA C-acetyltransferase [Arthrobacter sp. 2MCAF15]|uniref:acetyl-CoA C-acetyltransferase n=1 Tax=Arthrobacter sp. 2MCAF15 TaxID=3232984 RepID=UPI003F8E71D0